MDAAQKDLDNVTQRLKDLRAEKKENDDAKREVNKQVTDKTATAEEIMNQIADAAGVLDSKKRIAEAAATNLETAKDVAEKANADYEASKKAMDEAQANVDAAKQEVAGKNTALDQTKAAYKELAGKELESYDADTAKKHYDEATAGLEKAVAKKADADKNASIASDSVTDAEKTKEEADQTVRLKRKL